MSPNIPYAKLAELWQQDRRAEMVKYQSARGAEQPLRRGQLSVDMNGKLKFKRTRY